MQALREVAPSGVAVSAKVDGRCIICGERKLAMEGQANFTVWCRACGSSWHGAPLGDLVESAILPAGAPDPTDPLEDLGEDDDAE